MVRCICSDVEGTYFKGYDLNKGIRKALGVAIQDKMRKFLCGLIMYKEDQIMHKKVECYNRVA